jgi:hypothetical protein
LLRQSGFLMLVSGGDQRLLKCAGPRAGHAWAIEVVTRQPLECG